MDVTCSFPPGPRSAEWAQLAESLGYRRVYLHDSPALYWDVWAALAHVADHTEQIGLGALVIPHLRHVLTTASAVATIEDIAPGRLAIVVGTGFTARAMLGQRPLPWRRVEQFVTTLRALLRGDEVEVDGKLVAMRHSDGWAPARPIDVPIVIAANGPKGLEVARTVGDGVYAFAPTPGFTWSIFGSAGTVLADGEPVTSPRAFDALGPAIALNYHFTYEAAGAAAVDQLPGGSEWRASVETIDPAVRHLYVHDGHGVAPNARELPFLDPNLAAFSISGTDAELREKFAGIEAAGATEFAYAPMGSDVPRELRAMAAAAGLPAR
jgi:5,10-methylenetetrahydromethanopterin reductase